MVPSNQWLMCNSVVWPYISSTRRLDCNDINSGLWLAAFLYFNKIVYHCFCFCLHRFAAKNSDLCLGMPFYYLYFGVCCILNISYFWPTTTLSLIRWQLIGGEEGGRGALPNPAAHPLPLTGHRADPVVLQSKAQRWFLGAGSRRLLEAGGAPAAPPTASFPDHFNRWKGAQPKADKWEREKKGSSLSWMSGPSHQAA